MVRLIGLLSAILLSTATIVSAQLDDSAVLSDDAVVDVPATNVDHSAAPPRPHRNRRPRPPRPNDDTDAPTAQPSPPAPRPPKAGGGSAQTSALTKPSGIGQCRAPVVRREFRELPDADKQRFVEALKCLRDPAKSPSVLDVGSPSLWDDLVYVHATAQPVAHHAAAFLPWHRQFLGIFEYWMKANCGYGEGIPYWDWSVDSQAPERSEILSAKWFGGNGRRSDQCITNGQFKDMEVHFPEDKPRSCLTRRYHARRDGDDRVGLLPPLPSYAQIIEIMELSNSYEEIRDRLEGNPHGLVHDAIGGYMANVRHSPNDPLFFLHHANIDRLYAVWQAERPQLATTFDGPERDEEGDAEKTDVLRYFGIYPDPRVQTTLSTTAGDLLCYTYSNSILPAAAASGGVERRSLADDREEFMAWRQNRNRWAATGPAGAAPVYEGSPDNARTPDPYDRADRYNLRHTLPVSEDHFRQLGYTDEEIAVRREEEALYRDFIDYVNAAAGFVSKNALVYSEQSTGYHSNTEEEAALRANITKMLCRAANTVLSRFHVKLQDAVNVLNTIREGIEEAGSTRPLRMLARPIARAYRMLL